MQLPDVVRRIIEERAETVGLRALKQAAETLSASYRQGRGARIEGHQATAYLVTRMPATYAAAHAVLREVRERLGSPVADILDVGAGTGAASLAARAWFPGAAVTMVEREAALREAARWWLPEATALAGDVSQMAGLPRHDLVIAAYSLGEFGEAHWARLWAAARAALVVIEPGTPAGFARILGIREKLLAAGAHIVAPCPAETPCPMADPDWCHFAARVERSRMHRYIKDAELGYEDEKYSYLAVGREAAPPASARIVRRPRHQPGLIVLETCTAAGLESTRVTKRDREAFRRARQAGWGESF